MPSQTTPQPSSNDCTDPIFILGVMPRSGTNFLKDLVELHPDCGFAGPPLVEDYLVPSTNWLVKYVKSVAKDWNDLGRGVDYSSLEEELGHFLGNGLVSFLQSKIAEKRMLTKTPSVCNIKNFFKLFPKARLLILVRDGRAVVESGVKSFGWQYEDAFHEWAEAASSIIEFDRVHKASNYQYLIVRYEEVWNNLEEAVTRILNFLDLDREKYDLEKALNLPVRGSSTVRSDSGKMLWKAVEKTQSFNPLERWKNWDRAKHERFNWIAGHYMEALGYELQQYNSNQYIWAARNRALDLKRQAISLPKKTYLEFKQVLKAD